MHDERPGKIVEQPIQIHDEGVQIDLRVIEIITLNGLNCRRWKILDNVRCSTRSRRLTPPRTYSLARSFGKGALLQGLLRRALQPVQYFGLLAHERFYPGVSVLRHCTSSTAIQIEKMRSRFLKAFFTEVPPSQLDQGRFRTTMIRWISDLSAIDH